VNLVHAQPSLAVATLAWIHNIEQQHPGAPLVDVVLKELAASVLSVKSTEEKSTEVQDLMSELAILEAAVSHGTVSSKVRDSIIL
jgi:cystathionine beta-lyase/cystathionine gamma-synthase